MNNAEATLGSNGYQETVWLHQPLYLRGNILRLETDVGQLGHRSQYCGFGRRFGNKYCINLCGYFITARMFPVGRAFDNKCSS